MRALAAFVAGAALAASVTAFAGTTVQGADITHNRIIFGQQQLQQEVRLYFRGLSETLGSSLSGQPPLSLSGRIDRLQRDVQYLSSKLSALCRAQGTYC